MVTGKASEFNEALEVLLHAGKEDL